MRVPFDNADYSRMEDHDNPLNDPLVRAMRSHMPYFWLWTRPAEEIAEFRDGLRRAMLGDTAVEAEAQKPGESKNTSPGQDALLLQTRARGQRFSTDRKIGGVHPGESQPDEGDEHEFLNAPERWNAMRKKL